MLQVMCEVISGTGLASGIKSVMLKAVSNILKVQEAQSCRQRKKPGGKLVLLEALCGNQVAKVIATSLSNKRWAIKNILQ